MRTNKNTPRIILAITVAMLAALISYSTFSSMRKELNEQKKLINVMQQVQRDREKNNVETYAYAVATKELKAGEIVAEEDVDFKNFAEENKLAFENRSDIVNKVLLQDIGEGEIFTSTHIAKVSSDNIDLREGYRALTLPAESFQGKSTKMKAGSVVDIYSANTDSSWFLEGIRILNLESGQQKSDKNSKDINIFDANSITFEVPVAYVPDFISNISKNKLVLVTRGELEKPIKRNPPKVTSTKRQDYNESARLNSIPKIPSSIPTIGTATFSDLPAPVKPAVQGPSVEVIEANVKSKVTFD